MNTITLHAVVKGRVQGVWFRQSTLEQAESSGVTGWVQNLPNGDVEVMIQGEEKAVRQLETWLSQGPPLAAVADVESELVEDAQQYEIFEVLRQPR
ncbi:acylphosphatase [Marinobacterium jannaschii]|uniref:acylphosphatase n=1 Tax=Marinobacterium jannaschii TaxID=64970 RepID=UPI0004849C08|nr:acylphosphatase [Marinobacterium jannaschii]